MFMPTNRTLNGHMIRRTVPHTHRIPYDEQTALPDTA
jgi:hypothetical protein